MPVVKVKNVSKVVYEVETPEGASIGDLKTLAAKVAGAVRFLAPPHAPLLDRAQ